MARAKKTRRESEMAVGLPESGSFDVSGSEPVQTTGRQVVIFRDDVDAKKIKAMLTNTAGVKGFASVDDFKVTEASPKAMDDAQAVLMPRLGIAVVDGDSAQLSALMTASTEDQGDILAIEPEYIAYTRTASESAGAPFEYLRGYRDAVNHLYDKLIGKTEGGAAHIGVAEAFEDTAHLTWGLQATRTHTSKFTGQGIRLAVLDTGMDLLHPDFAGRPITSQSFTGEPVQDGNGHGTHCVGTACGPQSPAGGRRYGVAHQAQILVGKVLSNAGSGSTGGIVMGIEWALQNKCQVISMSLGANIDQKVQQYEVPIRRATALGALVVAAAGNNANRASGYFGFVGPPANADDAMAVAALDSQLRIANFSARSSSVTGDGGRVNIAGPGVAVYSAWPMPRRYNTISGTSMATPHVAGIAALWAQASGLRGAALWNKLCQTARPLNLPTADIGCGLVQAPQ